MKRKEIEALEPKKLPKGYSGEWGTTVQQLNDVMIFNVYKRRHLVGRHCVNSITGEYSTWLNSNAPVMAPYNMAGKDPLWTDRQVSFLYCPNLYTAYCCFSGKKYDEITYIPDKKDREILRKVFKLSDEKKSGAEYSLYPVRQWRREVENRESAYSTQKRRNTEDRRVGRVQDLMDRIPDVPKDFEDWCYNFMFGGIPGTASYHATTKLWYCSECHEESERDSFRYEDGSRAKTNTVGFCPVCGARVTVGRKTLKYTPVIKYSSQVVMFNDIDDNLAVVRYFDISAYTDPEAIMVTKGKHMDIAENIRIVLHKGVDAGMIGTLLGRKKVAPCKIYYRQYHFNEFDYKSNPAHRTEKPCMCYPNGEITAALKDTVYHKWAQPFEYFCKTGRMIDYNRCMVAYKGTTPMITEMLVKGRFTKIAEQYITEISLFTGERERYSDMVINERGRTANEVLMLKDTQAVNRLRDMDGDYNTLRWLRWAEREKRKMSQQALEFFSKNGISPTEIDFIYPRMTPEQIMNYLLRQQQESCKGMPISKKSWYGGQGYGILERWSDYFAMAKDLNKKIGDEMIYRPRDLAERHREYTEECNKKRAIIQAKKDKEAAKRQADEYRKKFPTAATILKDIKPKFEYSNGDYMIIVPKALTDIIFEGSQLHHCAGATDRYFDRIVQRETYICFLREKKNPKQPFYTIEVEPGGTIRQHRGMYDEEPDIELIKPFLRDWQKEIRKRMKEEDRKAAEISKKKRAENIKELEAKGNVRVLKGLMEDFMDIEEEEEAEKKEKASKKKKTVKKTA